MQVFSGALVYYEEPQPPAYDVTPCPLGGRLCDAFYLLDMTPQSTPGKFADAALPAGGSWSDPYGPVTIRVDGASSGGLDVTVSYDTPCAVISPAGRDHGVGSTTGTIDVTAPSGCNWTASTYRNPGWLTITAGDNGSGSGSVAYSLRTNDSFKPRKNWITIARQAFLVSQEYEKLPPEGLRLEPDGGRSPVDAVPEPEICFIYGDKNGWNDVQRLYALFNTQENLANACYVEYDRSTSRLRLGDDAGTGWAGPHHPDHSGSPNPENSYCSIRMGAPPGWNDDPAEEEYCLCLSVLFKSAIVGTRNVYLKAVDSSGLEGGWKNVGTYTVFVNQPPQAASLTPNTSSGLSQTFTAVFSDPNGAIDLQYVWLSFTGKDNSRACRIRANVSDAKLYLQSDDNRTSLPAVTLGSPEVRQNSNCGFLASGASLTKSGNDVTLTLPLVFTAKFAGLKDITLTAQDYGGVTKSTQAGTWTVPESACACSFDPAATQVNSGETKGTIRVTTGAACSWLAGSTTSWLRVTSNPSGQGNGTVSYTVLPNVTTSARSASIVVGGESFVVSQSGRDTALGPPILSRVPVNAASFLPRISGATWVTLLGVNLAPQTRMWDASDFIGNKLPAELAGVRVSMNGKPAFIYYISPTQINILTPDDDSEGQVVFNVVTPAGSTSMTASNVKFKLAPALFMFDPEGRKYVAGVHADGTYLGKVGLYPGLKLRPAKPGDTVLLYGTGFGATNPPCPADELVGQPAPLASPVVFTIGGKVTETRFTGLTGSGLYQFNVVVPDVPDGDQPVLAEVEGVKTQFLAYITVQK